MLKSDLPFGSEFSPSQVSLPDLLELAFRHEGDEKTLQVGIQKEFFSKHGGGSASNQRKLAMNCRLGMKAYGLLDGAARLTDLGMRLHACRHDATTLYDTFARHILLELHGMTLIQCIRDMSAAGEHVKLTTLRDSLAARGTHYPAGGKHPSMLRLWLAEAGVFVGHRWQVDEQRLRTVLGADPDTFGELSRFTPEQRAFVRALGNTGRSDPQPANAVAKLAEATYGVKFPEKSLPKLVLHTLVSAGYIVATKTTAGRGAKPFLVQPTGKLVAEVVDPLIEQLKSQTDPKLLALLQRPMPDIMDALASSDRYVAGLALEALAFKLMRVLDLSYVATRLRAQATGGAEVDLVFESARLVFSRWQVQCKNTARVTLDDAAKEVGLTHFLKSNVIVMVGTGEIGAETRRYANKIMAESNLCIAMLDRSDLAAIRKNPVYVVEALNREAHNAMALKKLDL